MSLYLCDNVSYDKYIFEGFMNHNMREFVSA